MTDSGRSRAVAVLALVGAVTAWSASLSVVRIAVATVAPGTVTFWRCVVGALVLWAIAHRRSRRAPAALPLVWPARDMRWCGWALACGAACGAAFLLIALGMRDVGSGPAGVVLSSIPALTIVLVASPLGGRGVPVGRRELLSLGLGVLAALTLAAMSGGTWSLVGLLALAGAALSHAVANVTSARSLQSKDPVTVAAVAMGGAALVTLPFAFGTTSMPSLGSMLAILVLGVIPSGLAYVMYFHGTRVLGAERAVFSNFLVPPVAVVTGMVALGEVPDTATFVALVLAFTALLVGIGGGARVPGGAHAGVEPGAAGRRMIR